jgi:multicomponent Na+:H+ antiporter subunit D
MIVGVLGAASQNHFRRILSFHITSQIGYMMMGLALFSPLALAGSIFYIIHHIIVKTNLFLISGIVDWVGGSYQLKKLGGLYSTLPLLGFLFLIPALSLAGIPPFSGFWPKFTLIQAGIEESEFVIVAAALFVSLFTLYSMSKIWIQAFWEKQPPANSHPLPTDRAGWLFRLTPVIILAACTLFISFAAEPVFNLSLKAAEQLLDPNLYVNTVLGGQNLISNN